MPRIFLRGFLFAGSINDTRNIASFSKPLTWRCGFSGVVQSTQHTPLVKPGLHVKAPGR